MLPAGSRQGEAGTGENGPPFATPGMGRRSPPAMNSGASPSPPPEGWPVSAEGIAYPPKPWRLEGVIHASAWLVPRTSLEGFLPDGIAPVGVGGKALVVTGWAEYGPGSILEYRELLCAAAVRSGKGFGLSVTHIWVDHPSSMAGGRELWGVPKQLARFTNATSLASGGEAWDETGPIASLAFEQTVSLPGTWRVPLRAVQSLRGGIAATKLRVGGRASLGRATWRFAEAGPLAFLSGHRPLLSARLSPAALSFGI